MVSYLTPRDQLSLFSTCRTLHRVVDTLPRKSLLMILQENDLVSALRLLRDPEYREALKDQVQQIVQLETPRSSWERCTSLMMTRTYTILGFAFPSLINRPPFGVEYKIILRMALKHDRMDIFQLMMDRFDPHSHGGSTHGLGIDLRSKLFEQAVQFHRWKALPWLRADLYVPGLRRECLRQHHYQSIPYLFSDPLRTFLLDCYHGHQGEILTHIETIPDLCQQSDITFLDIVHCFPHLLPQLRPYLPRVTYQGLLRVTYSKTLTDPLMTDPEKIEDIDHCVSQGQLPPVGGLYWVYAVEQAIKIHSPLVDPLIQEANHLDEDDPYDRRESPPTNYRLRACLHFRAVNLLETEWRTTASQQLTYACLTGDYLLALNTVIPASQELCECVDISVWDIIYTSKDPQFHQLLELEGVKPPNL